MNQCPSCSCKTIQHISGSILRCSQCGFQHDSKAKKKVSTPARAAFVQPGAEGAGTPGQKFPALSTACPTCSLPSRRVGSSKFEWICDNGHQFALNATGSNDVKLLDPADIGPISMGGS
jgi:hypothetical protein